MSGGLEHRGSMVVAGIDGCRGGWLAIILREDSWEAMVFSIEDLDILEGVCRISDLVLIDIPIGLPEKGERLCDVYARKMLGRRRGSVFPVPCRDAVYAESYEKAVEINLRVSGKKVSKQLWNIAPRIRAIDRFLREKGWVKEVLRESRPELCFWAISGHPMEKSKRSDAGIEERLKILEGVFPEARIVYESIQRKWPGSKVKKDDVVDALALAISAGLAVKYGMKSMPENPEKDGAGLYTAMFYGYKN